MDYRKRGRPQPGFNANGGFKKSKQEMETLSTGVGSKSKPCTKFFSTSGCPFGESCHFLHHVPGGYNAVSQMMNFPPAVPPASRNIAPQSSMMNGSSAPSAKTKICNRYNTAEGCKFGDNCHYAHGEWELGQQAGIRDDPCAMGPTHGRFGGRVEQPRSGPASSFGASATAKISVDASLAGAIIGKGGVISKQICRQTGAKLAIREHESDPNLRNIELEGTFEQIKGASAMVRELIVNISMTAPHKMTNTGKSGRPPPSGGNFKTKPCENFAKGRCTFGERCHFAHGVTELRNSGV